MFRAGFLVYRRAAMTSSLATAYAIASTLSVRDVAKTLAPRVTSQRVTKTQLTVQTGDGRWIVAYDFGAVVFFGHGAEERKAVLAELLETTGPEPHPPMQEEVAVEVSPDAKPQALADRVVVPRLDFDTVELVALVLAQSAAMEYYEEDVDALLRQVQEQMRVLEERGAFRGSVRAMVKFVGAGMSTRNQVVSTLSLLETPEMVWDDARLEGVYAGLRATFEIEDRFRALDLKLGVVQDNLEILVDLGQQRRSMILEVAIATMIALEILLVAYQIWKDTR